MKTRKVRGHLAAEVRGIVNRELAASVLSDLNEAEAEIFDQISVRIVRLRLAGLHGMRVEFHHPLW